MGSRGVSTESPLPPPLHRGLLILRSNVPFSSTSRPGLWKGVRGRVWGLGQVIVCWRDGCKCAFSRMDHEGGVKGMHRGRRQRWREKDKREREREFLIKWQSNICILLDQSWANRSWIHGAYTKEVHQKCSKFFFPHWCVSVVDFSDVCKDGSRAPAVQIPQTMFQLDWFFFCPCLSQRKH